MGRRPRRALCVAQWQRLGRRRPDAVEASALDAARVQCTAEYDHSIRHRLLARFQRVVAAPYCAGAHDASYAVVDGVSVDKRRTPVNRRHRFVFLAVETNQPVLQTLDHLAQSTTAAVREHYWSTDPYGAEHVPELDVHPLPVTAMNQRKGFVVRFDKQATGTVVPQGAALRSGKLQARVVGSSANPSIDIDCVRHVNVVSVIRPPFLPWRRLRRRSSAAARPPAAPPARMLSVEARRERLVRHLDKMFRLVRRNGFANYFAVPHDRALMPPAMTAGRALAGDYESAVRNHLLERAQRGHLSRSAYFAWRDGVSRDEVRELLVPSSVEGSYSPKGPHLMETYRILHHAYAGDWRTAYHAVPPGTRAAGLLTIREHIFNYMLSARLLRYGLRVAAGDLVSVGAGSGVRRVTEGEARSGSFSVYDVLLPVVTLPFNSADYTFPSHDVGAGLVEEVLSDFGISMPAMQADVRLHEDWHRSVHPGIPLERYRPLLVRPHRVEWNLHDRSFLSAEAEAAAARAAAADPDGNGRLPKGHFLRDVPLRGSLPTPQVVPGGPFVVVTADLPPTAHMDALMREVFMSSTVGGMPAAWRASPLRPGAAMEVAPGVASA